MKGVKIFIVFFWALTAFSQEDSVTTKKFSDYVQLHGYIKDMQMFSFGDNLNDIVNDNLIHNRLNLHFYPSKSLSGAVEVRNRIFLGESVEANPGYADMVDVDNGILDLSWILVDEPSLVFLTQIDRAWLNWSNKKWDIRLGRQRINWGTNLFWNSNDLFNAYSLVDFDYEERQGTDALRVQRHFKNMKTIELAVKPGKDSSDWVGAAMYRFNKWQYDFQFLAGWWYDDVVAGVGWAGNIKYIGFKGEASYFVDRTDGEDVLSASISADYIFSNKLFLTGGFLFNSSGVDTVSAVPQNLFLAPISAKNIMPMKYSVLLSLNYPITELFTAGLVSIYSPGVNTAFFMPSFGFSIANNWDASIYGQSFWMDTGSFDNLGNAVYLRVKGSF
jgi:hypothetical protein